MQLRLRKGEVKEFCSRVNSAAVYEMVKMCLVT